MSTEQAVDTAALDSWLAEHLFGWTHLHFTGPAELQRIGLSPTDDEYEPLPAYSTTGDGMLMVLEAMQERGWFVTLTDYALPRWWEVEFLPDPLKPGEVVLGKAPVLPTAVSLAAKAALEA